MAGSCRSTACLYCLVPLVGFRYCNEMADYTTQEGIWDPEPARGIASDPEDLRAFDAYYGPLDLRNEHELQRDRQQQLAGLSQKRQRLTSWLSDRRLKHWADRLTKLDAGEPSARSFLSLLFDEQGTVARRLSMMQQRFATSGISVALFSFTALPLTKC